jgi:hypothetical protein
MWPFARPRAEVVAGVIGLASVWLVGAGMTALVTGHYREGLVELVAGLTVAADIGQSWDADESLSTL